MSSIQRLKELEQDKERIAFQIVDINRCKHLCFQDWKSETNLARRSQLNAQIDTYSTAIDQLYEELEDIEDKISQLKLDEPSLNANNHLDNPHNQLELNLDECLSLEVDEMSNGKLNIWNRLDSLAIIISGGVALGGAIALLPGAIIGGLIGATYGWYINFINLESR